MSPGHVFPGCNYRPLYVFKKNGAAQESKNRHQPPHSDGLHTGWWSVNKKHSIKTYTPTCWTELCLFSDHSPYRSPSASAPCCYMSPLRWQQLTSRARWLCSHWPFGFWQNFARCPNETAFTARTRTKQTPERHALKWLRGDSNVITEGVWKNGRWLNCKISSRLLNKYWLECFSIIYDKGCVRLL